MDLVEEMEVQELPYQYVNLRKPFKIETRPKKQPMHAHASRVF